MLFSGKLVIYVDLIASQVHSWQECKDGRGRREAKRAAVAEMHFFVLCAKLDNSWWLSEATWKHLPTRRF